MWHDLFPIVWKDFHFVRPQFLWLFIPVTLIFILGWINMRQDVKWKKAIAPHLRPFVIKKGGEHTRLWMNFVLGIAFSFGVLAISGPTWKKVELPGQQLETPMVLLLDLSQSMMAQDIQPNRLERAKFKIKDLLDYDPGARVALIGFAGTAHTIVPLTKDYEIIRSHLDGLKPSIMPVSGSNLNAALMVVDTLLKVTTAPGTILILSDDFTEADFSLIQQFTANSYHKISILPINTEVGSNVPAFNGKGLMKDTAGNPVFSALNATVLSQMQSLKNVNVHALTLDNSDVELISKTVRANLEFTEKSKEKEDEWRDTRILFLLPMALLLLLWFRKGWVLYALFPLMLASCQPGTRYADLWFTRDYQAQKLENKKNYAEAAQLFEDPMRKGVAYFKAGNFDEAIRAFNEDTSAMGSYNLGLAYLQKGDSISAKLAFGIAVEKDSTMNMARELEQKLAHVSPGSEEVDPQKAKEAGKEDTAKNAQNDSMEDLSGGGQEATKKDMEKERKEETVATGIRKGKELDEVPEDVGAAKQQQSGNVLMRKVDDDPSLFLKRKFAYQVKKYKLQPAADETNW